MPPPLLQILLLRPETHIGHPLFHTVLQTELWPEEVLEAEGEVDFLVGYGSCLPDPLNSSSDIFGSSLDLE